LVPTSLGTKGLFIFGNDAFAQIDKALGKKD
jgi:hypothetical protein